MKSNIAAIIVVSTPYFRARFAAVHTRESIHQLHSIEMGFHSTTYDFVPDLSVDTYARHVLAEDSMENQSSDSINERVTHALTSIKPDLIAIPGWLGTASFAAIKWAQRKAIPIILMSESTAHDERRTFWKEWVKRRLVRLCSTALCGGTAHAAYLEQLGMSRDQIFLGYDAVDNAHFAKATKKSSERPLPKQAQAGAPWPLVLLGDGPMRPELEALAADLGLLPSIFDGAVGQGENPAPSSAAASSHPYFLASARFVEKKNLLRLLRAYVRYRELCAGPDPKGQADSVAPGSLPPATNVAAALTLPGFKQYGELPAWYHGAGAFIHASTTEQWGLVVNEAMAAGLPVLVSKRCGCAPDLVQEGVNGWTFDPFHEEAMAQAMLKMAALPEAERTAMGNASLDIIADWGPARFADGLSQSAAQATATEPRKASWIDKLLLAVLQWR